MISRKLNWLPGIHYSNHSQIKVLEKKIAAFYKNNQGYYGDIDFTADNWINENEEGYKQIISYLCESKMACEFGCGNANILKHFPQFQPGYSGCDFSEQLIKRNKEKYPEASFELISIPNELPYPDEAFDMVFSVFVLEHCTFPSKLLDECYRILQSGGRLTILCPDFLGRGRMSSQRSGWSEGTTSDKIKKGKYIDALLTFFDNRLRIPVYCMIKRSKARKHPQFLINIDPIVFEDKFNPDVDAVYLTYKNEITKYLEKKFTVEKNSKELECYSKNNKLIFLSFRKK
jgi:SAM-dependent methyltransferase